MRWDRQDYAQSQVALYGTGVCCEILPNIHFGFASYVGGFEEKDECIERRREGKNIRRQQLIEAER